MSSSILGSGSYITAVKMWTATTKLIPPRQQSNPDLTVGMLTSIHLYMLTMIHRMQGIRIFSRWRWESPGLAWMLQKSWCGAHSLTGATCNIIIRLSFYLTFIPQMGSISKQSTFHLKGIFDQLSSAEKGYLCTWAVMNLTSYLSCGFIQVAQEFALICKEENVRGKFEESFILWCRAIALYCKQSQIKSSALQAETSDYSEDLDDGKCVCIDNFFTWHRLAVIVLNSVFHSMWLSMRKGTTLH